MVVHVHAGVGAYRLAMKWGPLTSANTRVMRARLKVATWCIVGFFLCLGTASLLTYMKIGHDHADRVGEPYIPATESPTREGV